jgi:hypothetical protein
MTAEAIRTFDEETAVNIIGNTFQDEASAFPKIINALLIR